MEEEMELRRYLEVLRKRWIIVITLPLVAVIISGGISFSAKLVPTATVAPTAPVYQAYTRIIVWPKSLDDSTQSAGNILDYKGPLENQQLAYTPAESQQLATTYGLIMRSHTVEQNVLNALSLPMSIEELDPMISVTSVNNTAVMQITVTSTKPELAALIANATAKEFSKVISEENVSIVDRAVTPTIPVPTPTPTPTPKKSNRELNLLMALIMGLVTSVGLAFLLEYLDNTIKTSKEVETLLGIPVLGIIPHYDIEKQTALISEAFRILRTNVMYASEGNSKIMLTSTGHGEGKSATVAKLAEYLAQSGKSVLVLDADLRKPTQHKLFGLDNEEGLSVALVQAQDYRKYIKETSVPGLMVLTAGPVPANPAELVGSEGMKHVIEEASKQFDLVLIDTPSIIAVADAAILAQEVDSIIMVFASGKVDKDYAQRAIDGLERVGAKILGAVLNKTSMKASEYYYHDYYVKDSV